MPMRMTWRPGRHGPTLYSYPETARPAETPAPAARPQPAEPEPKPRKQALVGAGAPR